MTALQSTCPAFPSISPQHSGVITARQEAELCCWHCWALAASACCLGKKED